MTNWFTRLVDAFSSAPSSETMTSLAEAARDTELTDEEIAYLARVLANSGKRLRTDGPTADIPSTGGPSSLSTLLCPLYLRLYGFRVPKLTVPGRPAGGIDVLAQIPGYEITLSEDRILQTLDNSGYVHILADGRFAPLDALLFSFRKRAGLLSIPALVIASILSKKLAIGVDYVGLDIRVGPHGNFGANQEEARANARRFIAVANVLGIRACCFLTDSRTPLQPFIGRGESLLALHSIFEGEDQPSLRKHILDCQRMSESLACLAGIESKQGDRFGLRKIFEQNLLSQSSHYSAFCDHVAQVGTSPSRKLLARSDGIPCLDLMQIRAVLTEVQAQRVTDNTLFPDPCGLELTYGEGVSVCSSETIARVRCDEDMRIALLDRISDCFVFVSSQPPTPFFEVIANG